jgi:hypothetical protein
MKRKKGKRHTGKFEGFGLQRKGFSRVQGIPFKDTGASHLSGIRGGPNTVCF